LESAYEAGKAEGFDSGRKVGLEEAAQLIVSQDNRYKDIHKSFDAKHIADAITNLATRTLTN
jgi:flagellar biosynthesis/type III secretory pathway protein FliH